MHREWTAGRLERERERRRLRGRGRDRVGRGVAQGLAERRGEDLEARVGGPELPRYLFPQRGEEEVSRRHRDRAEDDPLRIEDEHQVGDALREVARGLAEEPQGEAIA